MERAGSDVAWRVLPDGTVWVGRDSWNPTGGDTKADILTADLTIGVVRTGFMPGVHPGETFRGARVSYVEHALSFEQLRTRIWMEK